MAKTSRSHAHAKRRPARLPKPKSDLPEQIHPLVITNSPYDPNQDEQKLQQPVLAYPAYPRPNIAAGFFPKRRKLTDIPPQREESFRQWARDEAHRLRWADYTTWNSKHSPPGWPDLTLIRPPRMIFAELKNEEGNPTPDQVYTLQLINLIPWVEAYLWYPEDKPLITQILVAEQRPFNPDLTRHTFQIERPEQLDLVAALELWNPAEHHTNCLCLPCHLGNIMAPKLGLTPRIMELHQENTNGR